MGTGLQCWLKKQILSAVALARRSVTFRRKKGPQKIGPEDCAEREYLQKILEEAIKTDAAVRKIFGKGAK